MKLPEEYKVAREVYQMCCVLPYGQKISRAEINLRMRATSDLHKSDLISNAILSMLHHGQIQKQMDRESCTVFFWATANSQERGEPIRDNRANVFPPNYLIEPPPPPKPTPEPTVPPAPPVVVPVRVADKPIKERIVELLYPQTTVMRVEVMAEKLSMRLADLLEVIADLWQQRVIYKTNNPANTSRMIVWLPSLQCKYVNDPHPEDMDEEEPMEEFYMMRDMKSKNHRLLLRPTGDTVRLSLEELEFIVSLKKPFVTL